MERDVGQENADNGYNQDAQNNDGSPDGLQQDGDPGGFDEMDLTPYEDDDDATLHRKLVAAKIARKRAEEDLKLLCNRIGLLKMEEGKVVKKIDETRKRANQIISQRQRNVEMNQAKQARAQKAQMDVAMRTAMNRRLKETQAAMVAESKAASSAKVRDAALEAKQDKATARERLDMQRRQEEGKAHNLKMMIQQQKAEARSQRELDQIARQNRTRQQIEEKLQREAYEQQQYEAEVQRMEKEELELIMRLKNTKLLEEAAHNELETALNDPDPGAKLAQQQQTQGRQPARGKMGSRGGKR